MSKEGSSVPDGSKLQQQTDADNTANVKDKKTDNDKPQPKKKKKKNLWALKACIITLFLSLAVNAASELALEGAHIAIAIVILCPLLHSIEGIQALPWNLPQAFLYIPFYAFSNQCKTYIATMSLSRRNCFLTCLSLMLALAGTLHIHDFGETIKDILTVACGILILPTYILFIKSIAKIFPKMKKAASFIGKNTIIILALQNYIIGVFKIILNHIGYDNGNYGMNILLTLLTVVVCIIPIQIINKYIPFSIGRGTFFEKKLKQ